MEISANILILILKLFIEKNAKKPHFYESFLFTL